MKIFCNGRHDFKTCYVTCRFLAETHSQLRSDGDIMSTTEEEVDYLHPDGTKKKAPVTKEEKENVEKAEEMTELVEEIKEEQKS